MPSYTIPSYLPSGRPILAKLEHLMPQRAMLMASDGRIVLGAWASELAHYLDLNPVGDLLEANLVGPRIVLDNALLRSWNRTTPLQEFLAEQRVTVLYLDPSELEWLRVLPQARNMLENPRAVGWRDVAHGERGARSWLL